MPRIDIVKRSPIVEWHGEIPLESFDWQVGLIVGPSGCGKSSILEHMFGAPVSFKWLAPSVVEDFDEKISMTDIANACRSVGFNTVPNWLRPYAVLSNGERFRVDLARRLLEVKGNIVVDEFTSVVDRQVAQIGAHAVQKFVRKHNKRFVAASCHFDIIDWLQPDWVLEPATMQFSRRSLQRRPKLELTISRVPHSTWQLFAPYHYLTADLNKAARCFALFVGERIASFAAFLHMPISAGRGYKKMYRISRVVTLPDWQGLGLGPLLEDVLGGACKSLGARLRTYPAHPAFVAVHRQSSSWRLIKEPGVFTRINVHRTLTGSMGGRPCAVFEYVGPAMSNKNDARLLIDDRLAS